MPTKQLGVIIGKIGKRLPGGSSYITVIEKLSGAAVDGALGLATGLEKANGVAIYVKVDGECCEFERCGWLWQSKRLNWRKKSGTWVKCDANDPRFGDPSFPGFPISNRGGLAKAVVDCIDKAKRQFQCP